MALVWSAFPALPLILTWAFRQPGAIGLCVGIVIGMSFKFSVGWNAAAKRRRNMAYAKADKEYEEERI